MKQVWYKYANFKHFHCAISWNSIIFSGKNLFARLVIALRFHFDDLLDEYQRHIETGNRIEPQLMADVLIVIYEATRIDEENNELAFRRKWSHLLQLTIDSIISLDYMNKMGTCDDLHQRYPSVWKHVMMRWCAMMFVHQQENRWLIVNFVRISVKSTLYGQLVNKCQLIWHHANSIDYWSQNWETSA